MTDPVMVKELAEELEQLREAAGFLAVAARPEDCMKAMKALAVHLDQHWDTIIEALEQVAQLEKENADLRISVVAFGAPWAVDYAASFGLAKGEMHPVHYDILASTGARMDDFRRADLPDPPAIDLPSLVEDGG